MHERMGSARRMIWYCWLWVAFCSARVWMSFSCSVREKNVSHPCAWEDYNVWLYSMNEGYLGAYLLHPGPLGCCRWSSRRWGSGMCGGAASLRCLCPWFLHLL